MLLPWASMGFPSPRWMLAEHHINIQLSFLDSITGAHRKAALVPVGCISESRVPHHKIQDMFQYSFKMSKIFFQHLLLLNLQSWLLHRIQFLSLYNIHFVPIPMEVRKSHRHNFLNYTQIYVCFLMISILYSLSPALMNSLCTSNSFECNGFPAHLGFSPRARHVSTSQQQTAFVSISNFFMDVRFSFYWKNFLFKRISC